MLQQSLLVAPVASSQLQKDTFNCHHQCLQMCNEVSYCTAQVHEPRQIRMKQCVMAFAEKKVGLIIQAVIEDVGELYLGL